MRRTAVLYGLGCSVYALAYLSGQHLDRNRSLPWILAHYREFLLSYALPWLMLTPLVFYLSHRTVHLSRRLASHLASHFLFFTLISITKSSLLLTLHDPSRWIDTHRFIEDSLQPISSHFGVDSLFYVMLIFSHRTYIHLNTIRNIQRSLAEQSRLVAQAQLQALQMQLQPHFIFNAIHSINALILEKNRQAAGQMIKQLSMLLRLSMQTDATQMVCLKDELQGLDCYLSIVEIRFKDRLKVESCIDPDLLGSRVPSLLLQPLVENAVKHGVAKRMGFSKIHIRAERDADRLLLEVHNDGPQLPENFDLMTEAGLGIGNTLKRLEIFYQDRFELSLDNREEGGVSARVAIPCAGVGVEAV